MLEEFIQSKALIQKAGIAYLTLAAAREVLVYCQQHDFAILGIDGFRDYGNGKIVATLDLSADFSPPRNSTDRLAWTEFRDGVNTFALEFILKLSEVEKAENIRVLVEVLIQEPYDKN